MKNTSLGLLLGCMALGFGNCFRNNYNCIERYITYYRLSTEFIDDFTYYDCRSSNHASFSAKNSVEIKEELL